MILSQRPTPGTIEYSTNRFCGETYVLAGVLKSQVFKLCFGAKLFVPGRKLAKLRKEEDRRSQPAPTVGPTANGGTNASFCTSGDFQFFLARGQVCFEFDSATVKRENKERSKDNKDCGQRQRENISLIFRRASSLIWRRKSTIVYTWGEEFLIQSTSMFMCSHVCLCVIERTIGVSTSVKVLYHERERENGPLFRFTLCMTVVFRCAQRRPSDRCRWSSNDLCFSFWKNSDTRSPPLRRGERLHGLFFFGLRTVFVSRSDRRRKESKQTPVFVRSLDRRRQKKKKKKNRHLWSEIDQTQGCASRAIDRAPASARPRLRYDLRNRRPGSPWYVRCLTMF